MPIRIYQLYTAAAAAANMANVQLVKSAEIVAVSFSLVSVVNNGVAFELSVTAARQYGTNNTQGIIALAFVSNIAAQVAGLDRNHFIAIPPGCKLGTGEFLYLHGTQIGSAGTATCQLSIYCRES